MRKILNPYLDLEGYTCFGCSPDSTLGLRCEFWEDGDEVTTSWVPDNRYCGFKGVLHGGIQALAHDELASWVVYVKCGTSGFTRSVKVDFKAPVLVSQGEVRLRAHLDRMEGNVAFVATRLYDGSGALCSEAVAEYSTVPERVARRMFAYPGRDAFFAPQQQEAMRTR